MERIYLLITWSTAWVLLSLGMTLLFFVTSRNQKLANYKTSKFILGGLYFFIGLLNVSEALSSHDINSIWYPRILILTTGSILALLLTSINITLIEPTYLSLKKISRKVGFIVLLTLVSMLCLLLLPNSAFFYTIYILFVIYYILVFIKYSILFKKHYSEYRMRYENYYSENEKNQLAWVQTTQYVAIAMGLTALLSLFMPQWWMIAFSVIVILFYSYYGIRFLNYSSIFFDIEPILEYTEPQIAKLPTLSFVQLEKALNEWENKKSYVRPNITIETVAAELNTNRTYLSSYINTYKKKSFREWINDLRIKEAQQILISRNIMTMSEVGELVGIPDKSNFGRQFVKRAGVTPLVWRNSKCAQ